MARAALLTRLNAYRRLAFSLVSLPADRAGPPRRKTPPRSGNSPPNPAKASPARSAGAQTLRPRRDAARLTPRSWCHDGQAAPREAAANQIELERSFTHSLHDGCQRPRPSTSDVVRCVSLLPAGLAGGF